MIYITCVLSQLAQKLNQFDANVSLARAEEGHSMTTWDEESTLQSDIQRLTQRLQDLILGRLAASAATSSQQASVKRYREILLDLKADFEKCASTVRRSKERHELMAGSASVGGGGTSLDPAMDHLLRERNHIENSMNAASGVLGQADSIRSDLYSQGRSLRGTNSLMSQLTTNIPGLNHLVDQIRRKRSRDDKIVAGVIVTCVTFTLWYMFG
jgi:Golgi SNAP receptor complex protein 1